MSMVVVHDRLFPVLRDGSSRLFVSSFYRTGWQPVAGVTGRIHLCSVNESVKERSIDEGSCIKYI